MNLNNTFVQITDKTLEPQSASALIALRNEANQNAVAAAIDAIFSKNSATFAQLLTVTKAEASWFFKGHKDLAEEIYKISSRNVTLNADYERSVIRSIEKLGGDSSAFSVGKSYTKKDPSYNLSALLCHYNDESRKYLRCHINKSKTLIFNVKTGQFLNVDDIQALPLTKAGETAFVKAPSTTQKVSQGVEHDVEPKNFKLEGVIAIRANGETIAL
jgi:hypothetical protein